MYIAWMLILGLLTGTIAHLVMPGRVGGVIMTIALGLTGSFLAGFFGRGLGLYKGAFDLAGIFASVFGALVVLLLFRLIVGPRDRKAVA